MRPCLLTATSCPTLFAWPLAVALLLAITAAGPVPPITNVHTYEEDLLFNGTMHDFFFAPIQRASNVLDANRTDFDGLAALYRFAGVENLLRSRGEDNLGITLFAPVDEAFTQSARDIREVYNLQNTSIPTEENAAWVVFEAWFATMKHPKPTVANILRYGIVPSRQLTHDQLIEEITMTTLNGEHISRSGITLHDNEDRIPDAALTLAPYIQADNGVIHIVDRLPLPHPEGRGKPHKLVPPDSAVSPTPQFSAPESLNGDGAANSFSDSPPRPSPASDPSPNANQPSCFPASASIHMHDGSVISMSRLSAGDAVLTSVSSELPSQVFLFSHRMETGLYHFIRIATSNGHSITLSQGHYIYANRQRAAAHLVKPGDLLHTIDGDSHVISVRNVKERGLFSPHSLHGDLVVNGILVSSYTTAVSPPIAHALLWPLRMLVRSGISVEPLGSLLYNGNSRIAAMLPDGYDTH